MSSFGAIPMNLEEMKADFLVSSANKCLEGVPGFSYTLARKAALQKCKGRYEGYALKFRLTPDIKPNTNIISNPY